MKTSYGIGANIWRFQGFYFIFWFILFFCLSYRAGNKTSDALFFLIVVSFFAILWGWINLWFQPIVQIEEEGLKVKRLGLASRKIKWNNMRLFKKVRTLTRYCLIGVDPRYSIIEIKDGTIFDKRIAILSFFKEYDKFISEIEKHLNPSDVLKDKNYT